MDPQRTEWTHRDRLANLTCWFIVGLLAAGGYFVAAIHNDWALVFFLPIVVLSLRGCLRV